VYPTLGYEEDLQSALEGAELLVHVTDWKEYLELDPAKLLNLVDAPRLLDARNALDAAAWRAAGWTVAALGRPDSELVSARRERPILLQGWTAETATPKCVQKLQHDDLVLPQHCEAV
jgi:hypothetical protein